MDTGNGDKFSEKLLGIYGIDREPNLMQSISDAGLKPEQIDIVINTHLHFDHCGGNTLLDGEGSIRPAFPNDRYIIQRLEWEDATNPNELTRGSYLPENFIPLEKAGKVELLEGEAEVYPGVRVIPTPGHNRGHQSVRVDSYGKTAFFLGDLIPTAAHIPLPYITGYDLYPLELLETKRKLLSRAFEEQWLLIFEHDLDVRMGYLKDEGERFSILH